MTKEQMEQIVLANMQKIYLYCVRRLGNAAEAEDVASDITVELLGSYQRVKDDNAVLGYVWAVADNLCRNYWRKAERSSHSRFSETAITDMLWDFAERDRWRCPESTADMLLRRAICVF